jgi:predicted dehydrogenase
LALECEHFLEGVLEDRPIRSDGADGLRVVQVLEAGQESLKNHGAPVSPEEL